MSLKSRSFLIILVVVLAVIAIGVVVYSRIKSDGPKSGEVVDEARAGAARGCELSGRG